jgi:hypothetical protein
MTIEQKPELNRLVDSSFPITWPKRWRAFKLTLPIWVFMWVCTIEMGVLNAWLTNRPTADLISSLTGGLLGGFVALWGVFELALWFEGRSKRILQVQEKRLMVRPTKHQYIRWKALAKIQFEPIAENPTLTKCSVFVYFSKRVPEARRFRIVIESPAQVRELIQTLEAKRQATGTNFKIVALENPEPPPAVVPLTIFAFSLFLAGFYLLLHGLPLLGIALTPRNHEPNNHPEFDPEVAKLGRFLADHFSSVEQMHQFYLWTGIILTVAGLALMFWRSRLPAGKPGA